MKEEIAMVETMEEEVMVEEAIMEEDMVAVEVVVVDTKKETSMLRKVR